MSTQRYLTIRETADALGISEKTVRRRIQDGSIESTTIGTRTVRIPASVLDRIVTPELIERGTGAALATLTDHETGAGSDLRPGDIDLDDDTYIEIHGRIDIRQLVREILEATR